MWYKQANINFHDESPEQFNLLSDADKKKADTALIHILYFCLEEGLHCLKEQYKNISDIKLQTDRHLE